MIESEAGQTVMLTIVPALTGACILVSTQIDNRIRNAIITICSFFIFIYPNVLADSDLASCRTGGVH